MYKRQVTELLDIPTISVGAGPHTDGQLLVWTDWAGLTLGTTDWDLWDDDWTVVTRDRALTAQFEHTLVVTERGAEILTLP